MATDGHAVLLCEIEALQQQVREMKVGKAKVDGMKAKFKGKIMKLKHHVKEL